MRRLGLILILGALSGCASGTNGDDYPSPDETDSVNQDVSAINHTWEAARKGINACPINDMTQAAPCVHTALTRSRFAESVARLRSAIAKPLGRINTGACKTALTHLDGRLRTLTSSIARLDSDTQLSSLYSDIVPAAHTVRANWDRAVQAELATTKAC
jgi:hypothetical protein